MRTFIIASTLMIFSLGNGFTQTELPYFTGFDNDSQTAGWQEYRLGAESEFYLWNISTASPFSDPNSLNHNYPVGGSELTDDWFVSPEFNLPEGGVIDSLRFAFSGFGVPQDGDTIAIYVLTGSQDPALATSQTLLMDFRSKDYSNDDTWRLLSDVAIPPSDEESYLAFRYSTVVNWLDVRFDNLRISSNTIISVNDDENEVVLSVYPNPASEQIYVKTQNSIFQGNTVEVYDLRGKKVLSAKMNGNGIDVSKLQAGTYVLEVEFDGQRIQEQFVKN